MRYVKFDNAFVRTALQAHPSSTSEQEASKISRYQNMPVIVLLRYEHPKQRVPFRFAGFPVFPLFQSHKICGIDFVL